jgi:hypothetical protein
MREFQGVAEADIRAAHSEIVSRPALSGVPAYVYEAAVHCQDGDLKAHEAEVETQRHLLDGTCEP